MEKTLRPRRRTPAGATNPATRLHTRGRQRTTHARLVRFFSSPLPTAPPTSCREREVRPKRKGSASPGFSDGRGSFGKGVGLACWRRGCNSWETALVL